jgi:glycosyltransferase involved in cell wall biosynthesis
MKILFFVRSMENGGAERQLALLANGLAQHGHDVAIAVLYAGGVHERTLIPPVRIIDLKKGSRWNTATFSYRVLQIARRERPDVIHGYLGAGNLAATLAKQISRNSRLVWGIRNTDLLLTGHGWVTNLATRLNRLTASQAELMIFNSESARQLWMRLGHVAAASASIPNGIDTEQFAPDPKAGQEYRSQWGIPEKVPLVGMVARLDPAKDYGLFLEAAALVNRVRPDAKFLCLADGNSEHRDRLQGLAAQLGIGDRVIWPEPTRNMRGVYNAVDVFCLASIAEGFPNVVAEAMACGRTCVVTDTGDAGRIVAEHGYIVPEKAVNEFAGAILKVLNSGKPVNHAGRKHIVENYSIETLVSRTEFVLA